MANILIVDDEFEIRALLKELLEHHGFSCALAQDAAQARQELSRQSFELILLDIKMPGESGLEFLRQVRDQIPETAFMMVSVITDPEVAQTAIDLGAYGYVAKPFDPNEILINVASALRRRELEIERRVHLSELERLVAERTASLVESEKRYRTLIETMTEGLVIIDHQGRLTYVNEALCRMLQVNSEDILNRPLSDFLDEQARGGWKRRFQERKKGSEEKYEFTWKRADGRVVFSVVSPKPLFDEKGVFKGSFGVVTDITERKLAADALAQSEERYRGLMEAAPNAILVHSDFIIEYVNPAAVKLLRASGPDQLIRRSYLDLVHQKDRAGTEERSRTINGGQASVPVRQHRLVALDGQVIEVESTGAAFRQGGRTLVQTIALDITERKRTEEALKESERRYRELFNSISDLISTHDAEGRLISVNIAAAQALGYTTEELTSLRLTDLMLPQYRQAFHDDYMAEIKARGRAEGVFRLRAKDGKSHYLEYRNSLIQGDGPDLLVSSVARDITERRLAEKALKESEARFRMLVETMDQGLIQTDEKHITNYVNARFCQMLGRSAQELLGRPGDSFLDEANRRILMEQRARRRKGERGPYELTYLRADGEKVPTIVSPTPLFDEQGNFRGSFAVITDITERKKTEEAIIRAKEEWERTFDSVPDLIVILDKDYRIVRLNRAMAKRLGLSPQEAVGKICFELVHGTSEPPEFCPNRKTLSDGGLHSVEIMEKRLGGDFIITTSPLRIPDGEVVGSVHVARDVTEQKKMESRLLQAQKLEAIGQLAAGIAHEINTPTQYIHANIEFLEETFGKLGQATRQLPELLQSIKSGAPLEPVIQESEKALEEAGIDYMAEEVADAIRGSLDGVSRISKIVDSMRYFAHPGTEERSVIDVNQALENAVTVSRNEWKYWADLDTDLDPSLPSLSGFAAQLNQALLNIIINAAQAIGGKLGENPKEKGKISISTSRQDQWIEIRISDTGPGIPEEIRSRIFDPFFTTKEVGKGTGQGLALVHSVIVDKHGGTIDVETEVGQGTTFIARLPVNPEGAAELKLQS